MDGAIVHNSKIIVSLIPDRILNRPNILIPLAIAPEKEEAPPPNTIRQKDAHIEKKRDIRTKRDYQRDEVYRPRSNFSEREHAYAKPRNPYDRERVRDYERGIS